MPLIKIVPKPCQHKDAPRDIGLYGEGTIWECDDCHLWFELKLYPFPVGLIWERMNGSGKVH